MLVAIYSPGGTHGVTFLDNYTNIFVRDALLRVDGVGDVFTRADDFSMRIWLQPDKLAQLGLTANDVVNALAEQNLQIAAGSVGAPPQTGDQAFEYSVFTNSRLNSEEQFRNIIVRADPKEGSAVHLSDVARVQLGKFSYASNSFVDGKRASYLLVYQAPGSNALEVAKGVYAVMDGLKVSFPKDVDYVVPFESVSVVKVSINEVVLTLIEALGLVVLVVFLFLQSWRATLIPVLAIPVSIIGTFAFFVPLGFTINTGLGGRQQVAHRADAADARGDGRHLIERPAFGELLESAHLGDVELRVRHVALRRPDRCRSWRGLRCGLRDRS